MKDYLIILSTIRFQYLEVRYTKSQEITEHLCLWLVIQFYMKGKLDINQLYKRKYNINNPPNISFTMPLPCKAEILDKYGQLSQRLYPLEQKTSIKCVRIRTKNKASQVIKQSAYSVDLTDHCNKAKVRKNSVHPSQQKKCQLLRQMMKLSRKEPGDLQITMGGEKKLLKTLKQFFQCRNKMRQQEKAKKAECELIPVKRNFQRYSQRLNNPKGKQKVRLSELSTQINNQGEKEFAPWHSIDIEGQ